MRTSLSLFGMFLLVSSLVKSHNKYSPSARNELSVTIFPISRCSCSGFTRVEDEPLPPPPVRRLKASWHLLLYHSAYFSLPFDSVHFAYSFVAAFAVCPVAIVYIFLRPSSPLCFLGSAYLSKVVWSIYNFSPIRSKFRSRHLTHIRILYVR